MTHEEKISVIVPIYNVENYLERCLKSIQCQTYQNLEVLLIDDGSSDRSAQIAKRYCEKDRRFFYHYKKNGGLSSARNLGLNMCTGGIISFIDSDDYVKKDMMEKLYKSMKRCNSKMALCNFQYIYEEAAKLPETKISVSDGTITYQEFWDFYYEGCQAPCVVAWNKLYHRSLFEDIRFPEGKVNEDEFVIYDLMKQVDNISFVQELLYFYVQRTTSIMGSKNPVKMLDGIEALLKRNEQFYEDGSYHLCERTLHKCIYGLTDIYNLIRQNNMDLPERYVSLCEMLKKELFSHYKFVEDTKLYLKARIYRIVGYQFFIWISNWKRRGK